MIIADTYIYFSNYFTHIWLQLRKSFVSDAWNEMSDTVAAGDKLRLDLTDFAHCDTEIDACRWHICYQKSLSELRAICLEKAFAEIPTTSKDWRAAAQNHGRGVISLEYAQVRWALIELTNESILACFG